MNWRWCIVSTTMLVGIYLATGVLATRWWMALGNGVSVWGTSTIAAVKFSFEPIIVVLITAVPSALITLLNRRPVVHLWVLAVAAYQLYVGINFILRGAYFGCDRNGCGAEENFILNAAVFVLIALLGAGIIQVMLVGWAALRGEIIARRAARQNSGSAQ